MFIYNNFNFNMTSHVEIFFSNVPVRTQSGVESDIVWTEHYCRNYWPWSQMKLPSWSSSTSWKHNGVLSTLRAVTGWAVGSLGWFQHHHGAFMVSPDSHSQRYPEASDWSAIFLMPIWIRICVVESLDVKFRIFSSICVMSFGCFGMNNLKAMHIR